MKLMKLLLLALLLVFTTNASADPAFDGDSDQARYLRLHIGSDIFTKTPATTSRYGYDFGLAYEWAFTSVLGVMVDAELDVHNGKRLSDGTKKNLLISKNKLMLTARLLPGRHVWVPTLAAGGGWTDVHQYKNDFGTTLSGGGGISYFPYADNLLGSYGMKLALEGYYTRLFKTTFDVKTAYLILFVFAGSF